jgi:hypothetical protein
MMVDTNAPVAAAAPFEVLSEKVSAFLATARSTAAGGITWAEFGSLLVALLRLTVTTLDSIQSLTGEEKKAVALAAAGALFDIVADKAIPVGLWPIWILARPAVRSLVLSLAAGAIEQILPLVRSR